MIASALFQQIPAAIQARSAWERRVAASAQARSQALRRPSKPFPGASDLQFPLSDSLCEKLKPFFYLQAFGPDQLAYFSTLKPELLPFLTQAAQAFDYKLKLTSNLETELLHAIDQMLTSGRANVKVLWDSGRSALRFETVDPLFCIVPPTAEHLCEQAEPEWFVHVRHLSEWQYKHGPGSDQRNQDPAFLARLRAAARDGASSAQENRLRREGITMVGEGQLLEWEVYERVADGWMIHTLHPAFPKEPIRPSFALQYRHGRLPFVSFVTELRDRGYYSPRGVAERLLPFEAAASRLWNEKLDYMAFTSRPLFTTPAGYDYRNFHSMRLGPGSIIPNGMEPVSWPEPPGGFDREITQLRQVAEYHIGLPDFSVGRVGAPNEPRTATEVELAAEQGQQSGNLRARIFRIALGALYRQAWSLLVQYDRDLRYQVGGERYELPTAAWNDAYALEPAGGPLGWNRKAQLDRAIARKQLLRDSPYIDQAELDRSILESDDPRLVKRLFRPPPPAPAPVPGMNNPFLQTNP